MAKDGSERGRGGFFNLLSWAVGWAGGEDSRLVILSLDEITVDTRQPRRHFDQESLEQLARSIRANGVIEPLLVRKLASGGYQLITGERRLRAARLAGSTEIPAVVSPIAHESDIKKFQLIENLMRKDLSPIEEVYAYLDLLAARLAANPEGKVLMTAGLAERRSRMAELLRKLLKDFPQKARTKKAQTSKQAALVDAISSVFDEIGHTTWQEFVERRLQVLALPHELLTALGEGWLSYEQARALARITARAFGSTRATQERQRLLVWVKRSAPSLAELRGRIAERRADLISVQNSPMQTPAVRLKQVTRRLRTIKSSHIDQLPQKFQNRLERALKNLEAVVADIENKR